MAKDEFPNHLELIHADDLHAHLTKQLSLKKKTITIDLSHTTRASLACLQILIAAKQEAQNAKKKITFKLNDELTKTIEQLGLNKALIT